MSELVVGLVAFLVSTHGVSTAGVNTSGDLIGRLRLSNDMLRPFDHPIVLGVETGIYRSGSVYVPGISASLEVQLLKF